MLLNTSVTRAVFRLLIPLLVLLVYSGLSVLWLPFGGVGGGAFRLEIPLFLFLICCLFGFSVPRSRGQIVAVAAVVLLPVLCHDGLYLLLHRYARFSDLQDVAGLSLVSIWWGLGVCLLIFSWLALIIFSLWRCWGASGSWWPRAGVTLGLLGLLAFVGVCQIGVAPAQLKSLLPKYRVWDDQSTVRKYGRLTKMLVAQGQRRQNLRALAGRQHPARVPDFKVAAQSSMPDINILVLESFTDPRLIEGIEFSIDPLHPSLSRWLDGSAFDLVDVPVYGGGTPQTEFELLTGAPALSAYGHIEFNNLSGKTVLPGFVKGLAESGYELSAHIASSPRFYSSARAYPALGFANVCFIDLCDGFSTPDPYKHIHDADLLAHVASKSSADGRAVFRYVLGMYGHVAFERHPNIRPDVIELSGKFKSNRTLQDLANQFYYRTGAIASFLDSLHSRDSNVITLVVGDHLPPIYTGEISYQHELKKSVGLLVYGDRKISIDGMPAWKLPYLLAALASAKSSPDLEQFNAEEWYHYLMKVGIGNIE